MIRPTALALLLAAPLAGASAPTYFAHEGRILRADRTPEHAAASCNCKARV